MSLQRILLVQFADIGDLIVTTPAIAALREAQPDAHLTLLTSAHAAPIIQGTGLVNEIITFDKAAFNGTRAFFRPANLRRLFSIGHYAKVVYFHHFTLLAGTLKFALIGLASRAQQRIGLQNGNGWFLTHTLPDEGYGALHQAQYWLNLVALLGADPVPRPAVVRIEPFTMPTPAPTSERPKIVIHAGSGGYSLARRWSPEGFAAAADQLHRALNAEILLVGGKSDDSAAVRALMNTDTPVTDLTGQTTLPQLAGVIQSADLYIGADSGVMHLAAAAQTPIVALFGPSNHQAWHPWTPTSRHVVVRSGVECSPCSYIGHSVGLREGCEARTCMTLITAVQVVRAAKALLAESDLSSAVSGQRAAGSDPVLEKHTREHPGSTLLFQPSREPLFVAGSPQPFPAIERLHILGLPVDAITYEQLLMQINIWIRQGERAYHICTTNPEFMITALRDRNFRTILHRCDVCVPDGIGLLIAGRLLGKHLPERVTGSDGVPIIAARAAREGWRLYLLGAAPGVADQAAAILTERYPGLQIAGTYSGSPSADEEDAIVERINASGADVLFVAYGAPNQDKWIARNLPRLQVRMAMGVGGAFDFIAGIVPRAPLWMRSAGLEWLYRLILQPWRIRRQLRLPLFVLLVLLYRSRSPVR